ncbi:MAG: hypothetical protein AAB309_00335 [Deltaproteobacteria bacterium]
MEKSVQDKPIENTSIKDDEMFYVGGKAYKMPSDLKDLPEFDWNDPENQKMLKAEEEAQIKKYGKLTCKQMDQICETKAILLKEDSALPRKKAFDLAWEKVTGKKLPTIEK